MNRLIVLIKYSLQFLVSVILCQFALLSVGVVGWTYRLMQRSFLKRCWAKNLDDEQTAFFDFGKVDGLLHTTYHYVKIGAQGVITTWIVTLPGCVLMYCSWYAGWNNSFYKGYEHAAYGPALGLLGLLFFIVAMLYVPMAQARQAISDEWRRFFDFKVIAQLIVQKWMSCGFLAVGYTVLNLPVNLLIVMPMFFLQTNPELETLSQSELLHIMKRYYLWSTFWVLGSFIALRLLCVKIYTKSLLQALDKGVLSRKELSAVEIRCLDAAQLTPAFEDRLEPINYWNRALGWASVFWGFLGAAAMILIWFSFIAQVYIAQFFNYIPWGGWLNHALVHLPWIAHIPEGLQN